MQSILRIAALMLTATPIAAFAAPVTPVPQRVALATEVPEAVNPYAASKRARYASLVKQAEGLCGIYRGQARDICVGEARMKFNP